MENRRKTIKKDHAGVCLFLPYVPLGATRFDDVCLWLGDWLLGKHHVGMCALDQHHIMAEMVTGISTAL
jgi:hypothetical protein